MSIFSHFTRPNYDRLKHHATKLYDKIVYGWTEEDIPDLDSHLAKVILPRLKRFAELQRGGPIAMSDDEWKQTLRQMIEAFEWLSSNQRRDIGGLRFKENEDKARKGLELFAKYYTQLWF